MDTLAARVAARGVKGIATRVERDGVAQTDFTIPGVGVTRALNVGDNGATLEITASITLNVPDGLPDNFSCTCNVTTGTLTVHRTGTATLNGGTSDVTRAAATAANNVVKIQKKAAAEVYVVTGA